MFVGLHQPGVFVGLHQAGVFVGLHQPGVFVGLHQLGVFVGLHQPGVFVGLHHPGVPLQFVFVHCYWLECVYGVGLVLGLRFSMLLGAQPVQG